MCLGGKAKKEQAAQAAAQAAANAQLVAQVQAQSEANRLAAEKASNDALTMAKTQNETLMAQIAAQATAQGEATRTSAEGIQKMQENLLNAQKDSAAAAEMAMRNVGQKAKSPNIAALIKANKAAMSKGVGSTSLTGPRGIDPSALTLGKNSLLGA